LRLVATVRFACGNEAAKFLFGTNDTASVIPNAIEFDSFARAQSSGLRKELGVSDDTLVVLHVAQFSPVKNHTFSIEIASALKADGRNFKMVLVGTGECFDQVGERIESSCLGQSVVRLGKRTDVPEIMAAADVLIMPSHYEGFPVTLVEAQASGLPCIVSTEISREVDLGLGLVTFLPIVGGVDTWVSSLATVSESCRPSIARRREALGARGFLVGDSAATLLKYYLEE